MFIASKCNCSPNMCSRYNYESTSHISMFINMVRENDNRRLLCGKEGVLLRRGWHSLSAHTLPCTHDMVARGLLHRQNLNRAYNWCLTHLVSWRESTENPASLRENERMDKVSARWTDLFCGNIEGQAGGSEKDGLWESSCWYLSSLRLSKCGRRESCESMR